MNTVRLIVASLLPIVCCRCALCPGWTQGDAAVTSLFSELGLSSKPTFGKPVALAQGRPTPTGSQTKSSLLMMEEEEGDEEGSGGGGGGSASWGGADDLDGI
jgi:hypothetical protein